MKTKILLLCLALAMTFTYSQKTIAQSTEDDNSQTITREKSSARYDGDSYNITFVWNKKNDKKTITPHWTGIGMAFTNFNGINDLKNPDVNLSMSTSYSFILNISDFKIPLNNHLLLVSGTGLDFTRYHFKGDVGLTVDSDGITKFIESPDESYKSSKLITYYITIPLLLEYQTKVHRQTFHISGGMVGYIKYYSKSQVDAIVEGGVKARSLGRDLNILPVNGRFMLQAGIGDFSFFAYYSPFSLFEKDKGPDIKPIGMGVKLDF